MSNKELIERGREFARSTNLGGGKHLVSALCDALESVPEPQGELSDAQVQALKVLEEAEPLAEVFGNSTAFGRAVIALRRLVDEGAALRAAGGVR